MNNDIKLTVRGTQIDTNNEKNIDKSVEYGKYFKKNDVHYVFIEDEQNAHSARYKFTHRYLEVVKNGDVNAKLYFEASKKYTAVYRTPYGKMLLTFETIQLSLEEKDGMIRILSRYDIYNEDVLISNNTIDVLIENVIQS